MLPGDRLNVFVINQSQSMATELQDYGLAMAAGAADSINLYLQKLYQVREMNPGAFAGENFAVSVIGYGGKKNNARSLLYIDSSGTKADPEATRREEATISADAAHPVFPIWIKPVAEGRAPLSAALSLAFDTAASWITGHASAQPPQIINLTDGSATDGDPWPMAHEISELSTDLGHVAVWNFQMVGSNARPVLFPAEEMLRGEPFALGQLVKSSTPLAKESIRDIMLEFPEVSRIEGSKSCILNGDLPTLVRFLACVTRLPLP